MKKTKIFIVIIIFILIIFGVVCFCVKTGIELRRLNNMFNDIRILEDKVAIYYLNNQTLPINKDSDIEFLNSINPNDSDKFYEIDLEQLENINLSYGSGELGNSDKYVINEETHTIYYYNGIKYKNELFYTTNVEYSKFDLENFK